MNTGAPASQKAPPQGHALGGVRLHPRERAVCQNGVPPRFVDGDVEEGRELPHLPRPIGVHTRSLQKLSLTYYTHNLWQRPCPATPHSHIDLPQNDVEAL